MASRKKIRQENNCKPFKYFLDHVREIIHLYVPENLKASGAVSILIYQLLTVNSNSNIILIINTSLTPPHFIEVPVPCRKGQRSSICVLGVYILSFCDCSIGSWECSDSVVFFFCAIITLKVKWFVRQ